ncbi:hypothetical protein AAG570_005731 [Ranatra chinensis]|uniref:Uncharacterized protein n=1 Tax=Ranatra chinensis TaxID=642074 RepID=A0ABD0XYD7_9HEMI
MEVIKMVLKGFRYGKRSKFTSLMLAFKADKMTLKRRLELQNRLRDQTEINMNNEVDALKTVIQLLEPICMDCEKQEIYERIIHQVDALQKSVLRVSSVAEVYGAVQQENRMSKAVDVILAHVDCLKAAYEKEKSHHEEVKKLLSEHKPQAPGVANLQKDKRRASIATLHRHQSHSDGINSSHPDLKAFGMRKGPHGRRLIHTKSDYISDQHIGGLRSFSPTETGGDLTICEQDTANGGGNGGAGSLGWYRNGGCDNELDDEAEGGASFPLRRRPSQQPNG